MAVPPFASIGATAARIPASVCRLRSGVSPMSNASVSIGTLLKGTRPMRSRFWKRA